MRAEYTSELHWSNISTANVVVYREGAVLKTVSNSGFYADTLGKKVTGTFEYQVCSDAATPVCTNLDSITY